MNKLQEQVLEEFFRNETFYMKVIDNTKLNSNNLTQYDVELWTTDDNQKQCLNKLLDPRYKSYQIETINLVDLYEKYIICMIEHPLLEYPYFKMTKINLQCKIYNFN